MSTSPHLSYVLFSVFFLIQLQSLAVNANKMYNTCAPFSCGNFKNITYPFWSVNTQKSYCGHPKFKLDCQHGNLTMDIMSHKFQIFDIKQASQILRIGRVDLYTTITTIDSCPLQYIDVKVDFNFFKYTSSDENYTLLYECSPFPDPHSSNLSLELSEINACLIEGKVQVSYLVLSSRVVDFNILQCKHSITVPALNTSFTSIYEPLKTGFEVRWSGVDDEEVCHGCLKSGGRCGYNAYENEVICLLPTDSRTWYWQRKLIVGVVFIAVAILVLITTIYFYKHQQNRRSSAELEVQTINLPSQPSRQGSQHLRRSQNFGVQHFTYSELEVATNNFDPSKVLGDGGSGTVHQGTLLDGRIVAVKSLFENNHNNHNRDELFKNEVEILAKLFHPNLVCLYGCTSRNSCGLLLVYEYVSNGTLADHIHGNKASLALLSWERRMNIAVQTASALTYLHASHVIHRDIKTNNILLDEHLRVKVADFGLSCIFPNDRSHVSTAPLGTLGYIDPEYHRCYQLTKKSDVYSFGVVLIELISSLRAVDRERHEINLSNLAINKIQSQALHELADARLGFSSNSKVTEMINAVAELAFQCLQGSKEMRPSMAEVLERLTKIQSNGDNISEPEAADISSTADDMVLLRHDHTPLSPDSNVVSYNTAPSCSG